jgi:hypothetical protein
VIAARERAGQALYVGVVDARAMVEAGRAGERQPAEIRAAGLAAWSIAHGFAALWTGGAFADLPGEPDEIARMVLGRLSPPDMPPRHRFH